MKVWQIMTVFDLQLNSDPSSDIQKSDRHTIFSNIKGTKTHLIMRCWASLKQRKNMLTLIRISSL